MDFPTQDEFQQIRRHAEAQSSIIASLESEMKTVQESIARLVSKRDTLMAKESRVSPRALLVQQQEAELQIIEKEIKETIALKDPSFETRLQSLRRSHSAVSASLACHRSLLSPIRLLPTEILALIFNMTLSTTPFITPSVHHSPLLLTQVSHHWRTLAISTPSLWSCISTQVLSYTLHTSHELINSWLIRSEQYPISFEIISWQDAMDFVPAYETGQDLTSTVGSLLERFLPYFSQWLNVKLKYEGWRFPTGFKDSHSENSLNLQSLSITRDYFSVEQLATLTAVLFRPNTQLQSLTWYSETPLPSEFVPWHQLTFLALGTLLKPIALINLLRTTPNLIEGNFALVLADSEEVGDAQGQEKDPTVELSHLSRISLKTACGTLLCLEPVFSGLCARFLTSICIHVTGSMFDFLLPAHTAWPQDTFVGFLKKSPMVKSVELLDVPLAPVQLITILEITSRELNGLDLTNESRSLLRRAASKVSVDDAVLSLLTPLNGNVCCPKLTRLKLWDCVESTDGVLSRMIDSRQILAESERETAYLEVVTIMLFVDYSTSNTAHSNDIRRLRELQGQNVGITLLLD